MSSYYQKNIRVQIHNIKTKS